MNIRYPLYEGVYRILTSVPIYQCMSLFIFVIPGFKQANNKNRPVGILLFAKINLSK